MPAADNYSGHIIIDLTKNRDARPLKTKNEIIQQSAFQQMIQLLGKAMCDAREASETEDLEATLRRDDIALERRHNTLVLNGRRGSGKTTILLSLLDMLEKEPEKLGNPNLKAGDLVLLGVTDPTLIEDKENFFVSLLAQIQGKVEAHYRQKRHLSLGIDGNSHWDREYQDWEQHLKELAAGLCLLDGIGSDQIHGEAWESPTYILEKGLHNARSGQLLERRFHLFIAKSLKFLNRKAFLLALDDIDTNYQRGWPILEFLRKYLTSRQFITILSGDLELYASLIRTNQWRNFPVTLRIKDPQRWREYIRIVNQLESQYLQKILKPEYRVELLPLSYYFKAGDPGRFQLRLQPDISMRSLKDVLNEAAKQAFYLTANSDIEQLKEVFLSQPLRTVLQLLHAMNEELVPAFLTDSARPSNEEKTHPEDAIEYFHNDLASIFMESLFEKGLSTEDVISLPADKLLPLLAEFLTRNDAWQEGYRLKPEFSDDAFNLAALTLGARLARETNKSPGLILNYFLKIGLTREQILRLPGQKSKESIEQHLNFIGLRSNDSALQVARRALAVMREANGNLLSGNGSLLGTVHVAGNNYIPEPAIARLMENLDRASTHVKDYYKKLYWLDPVPGVHYNSLNSLQQFIPSWHKNFVTLPASIAFNRKESATFLSIFNLIGVMSELLASPGTETIEIMRTLDRASQLRSYPASSWSADAHPTVAPVEENAFPEARNNDGTQTVKHDTNSSYRFGDALRLWAAHSKNLTHPVHVLSKIWTRFFYTLTRIDEDMSSRSYFAGELMHRYIVAFLNAVLVEELLHLSEGDSRPILMNPTTSDTVFTDNLDRAKHSRIPTPLFDHLASCPLWAMYLAPKPNSDEGMDLFEWNLQKWQKIMDGALTKDRQKQMLKVRYANADWEGEFPNLYALLNTVPVFHRL